MTVPDRSSDLSNTDHIRSRADKHLFDLLLEDRTVKQVNEEIERATAADPKSGPAARGLRRSAAC